MTSVEQARALALALPEAVEQDHHGRVSFRVRGKIFATIPDSEHIRIMVDEAEIRAAVAENPAACEPVYWGKRLSCVAVELAAMPREQVRELLAEAWLGKAPKTLGREFLAGRGG